MSKESQNLLFVWAVASLMFFLNLGSTQLWDEDEPKNASCGREMLAAGNWVVPMYDGHLRPDKPILLYWLMMAAYSLFGVNEFSARLPSALLSVGTMMLVYRLGAILYRPRVGLIAAIVLSSSLMFHVLARASTPDGTLIFFITLALYGYVSGVARCRTGNFPDGASSKSENLIDNSPEAWLKWQPVGWLSWGIMYGAMGCAVLAKGPVGVLLPSCIIGVFLFLVNLPGGTSESTSPKRSLASFRQTIWKVVTWYLSPSNYLRTLSIVHAASGLTLVAAIALPWYILVGIETNGAWLQGFLGGHNVGRFLQPMEGHHGTPLYYIVAVLAGFFPASIFLPRAIYCACRSISLRDGQWQSHAFVCCWVGVYLAFFSLAATKLPNYVVPCYPALALLTATFLDRCCVAANVLDQWWFRVGLRFVGASGVAVVVGLLILAVQRLPATGPFVLVGLVLVVGAGIAYAFAQRGMSTSAVSMTVASCSLFTLLAMTAAAGHVNQFQDGPRLIQEARHRSELQDGGELRLGTYGYFTPTFVFYGEGHVEQLNRPRDVARKFAESPSAFVVVPKDHLSELRKHLPEDIDVVYEQRRFLRTSELVLLGRGRVDHRVSHAKTTKRY